MAERRSATMPEHQLLTSLAAVSGQNLRALSRPVLCVPADLPCEEVDLLFRRDPTLTSVAVLAEDGRIGLATHTTITQVMSGPMGFGRVLYARQPVAEVASWSPLVVDDRTSVEETATQVVLRAEDRWDDILVRSDQDLRVVGAVEVLQGLAAAFAARATHDDLTGLPNRSLFYAQIAEACAASADDEALVGVLYLDLDGFKEINDRRGHNAGDAELVAAARRLSAAARSGDVVARLGGDEFAVLLRLAPAGADRQAQRPAVHAAAVGERYRRALEEGGGALTASIGVAICRAGCVDPEMLLREADMAMYAAKHAGGNRVAITDRTGQHLTLGTDGLLEPHPDIAVRNALREAMRTDQLTLHYQPIVRLRDRLVVSVEALVRWQHPARGLLGPGDFLPDAERLDVLVELDDWVLDHAIAAYAAWRRDAVPGLPPFLNVNLSRASLQRPDLADLVAATLRRHALDPSHLRLELVEDAGTELLTAAAPGLAELRRHGVSLTWDDMGSGASSLKHVTQLIVDGLKIDRTFVAEMHTSPSALAVVRMLVHLADGLGMTVTAEGVETPEQLDTLTALGAGYGQGFHLARPAPADELLAWLATSPVLTRRGPGRA